MKNIKILYSAIIKIIAVVLLLSETGYSQWNFDASFTGEYNDNPFNSPSSNPSDISNIELGVYNNNNALSLGYDLNIINIYDQSDRNFLVHQFGLWKDFEESIFQITVETRANKSEYSYINYVSGAAFCKFERFDEDIIYTIVPSVSFTDYKSLLFLDHLKSSASARINKSFPSKTTLIAGAALNYKRYFASNQFYRSTGLDFESADIFQIASYLRIAQSIIPGLGAAAQYTNRTIFSDKETDFKTFNIYYGDESEVFDDPFNYETHGVSAELTSILFETVKLQAGWFYNKKSYPFQGNYDNNWIYNQSTFRSDRQHVFSFILTNSFELGDISLNLRVAYLKTDNASTSYPFDYKSNSISASIGLEY